MDVGKRKKRIFGAVILLLMVTLAIGTMVLANSDGWETSGSYSLLIQKAFADNTPATAKDQTYTFLINGTRTEIDHNGQKTEVPINATVTLPDQNGKWETTLYSSGPFNVTVTELTDDIQISEDGKDYNMSGSLCTTQALMLGSKAHQIQLKNNAEITIWRPSKINNGNTPLTTATWFHIYNEPYPGHHTVIKPLDEYFCLAPDDTKKVFSGLSAGIYTIEELRAPDGYSILVGPRTEHVPVAADGTAIGHFHINGNPGRLTVTAGGTTGDGATHYYRLDRALGNSNDNVAFTPRIFRVDSGEQYVIDDLPKGDYTVTEHTYGGRSGYTLTTTQQQLIQTINTRSSALSYTDSRSWKSFTASSNADYVILTGFGPLYNGNGNKLTNSITYKNFYYGVSTDDGQYVNRLGGYTNSTPFQGSLSYTPRNAPDIVLSADKKLYFSITGVNDATAKKIGVSWKEYAEKEVTSSCTNPFGSPTTKTVDLSGWMIFEKDPDNNEGANELVYHYTVAASDKSFASCTVTDPDGNPLSDGNILQIAGNDKSATISLKAGQKIRLNGLQKGTYTITETVDTDQADGFTMEIVGCAVSITEAGQSSEIITHGPRRLTISKPKCLDNADDHGRDYTFEVAQNNTVLKTVTLHAGENGYIDLPGAGTYTVRPTNELPEPFQMVYTDSSSVNGPAQGSPSATIKFTNAFSTGDGGYRYIHEYYLKESNGNYRYEGSSEMKYVRGRPLDEFYQALDIDQEPMFSVDGKAYEYTHFSEGYGTVDVTQSVNSQSDALSAEEEALTETETMTETTTETSSETEEPETSPDDTAGATEATEETTADSTESSIEASSPADVTEPETQTQPSADPPETGAESSSPAETAEPETQEQTSSVSTEAGTETEPSLENEPADESQNPDSPTGQPAYFSKNDISDIDTDPDTKPTVPAETSSVLDENDDESTSVVSPAEDTSSENEPDTSREETEASTEETESTVEQTGNTTEETPDTEEGSISPDEAPEDEEALPETEEETATAPAKPDLSAKPASHAADSRATATGSDGILTTGDGLGFDNIRRSYTVNPQMNRADVTPDGSNIIILRYYREVPQEIQGGYKVIHVYYLRDEAGDHREGISEVIDREGQIGHSYTATGEPLITAPTNFDVDGKHYTYTHDQRPQYGVLLPGDNTQGDQVTGNPLDGYTLNGYLYRPDTSWSSVKATKDGDQIIILRYYREVGGYYNIIHEYYYRRPGFDGGDIEENPDGGETESKDNTGNPSETVSAARNDSRLAASPSSAGGTLADSSQYIYTLEGIRPVTQIRAPLGSIHQGEVSDRILDYGSRRYAWHSVVYGELNDAGQYSSIINKQWAVATEDGQQIIILRYYREDSAPDKPTPPPEELPPPPENPGTTPEESETPPEEESETPQTWPKETETTTEETETTTEDPENPGYPTELPDPNDPDSPDRITIWEDGVPKTYIRIWDPDNEEYVYILDEDPPLAPMTGDESQSALWMALMLGSLTALCALYVTRSRKKQGNEALENKTGV